MNNQKDNHNSELVVPEFNRVIHEPSRLIILAHLYLVKNADLIFFKRKTKLSWGNLSSHASRLEESGLIKIEKIFRNNKPVTILEISAEGRKAFREYKQMIKKILRE
ncbi:MAG: transcriptional regulator [Candidatus Hodarchaeales archaeon]|jgi:DNA-binding transcriptional ArsR family regulator